MLQVHLSTFTNLAAPKRVPATQVHQFQIFFTEKLFDNEMLRDYIIW